MANELAITAKIRFSKGGAEITKAESKSVDVAGDAYASKVQSIPTSNTALTVDAAIVTAGYYLIKNLDATNFVTVGLTGSYAIKLLPKEFCLFRAAGTIYALANEATCLIEFVLIEL